LIAVTGYIYYVTVFGAGNFVEEFALPFILISMIIFIDYFNNGIINTFRLIVCGASLGVILMLRANMCALWAVMCIAVMIKCIKDKNSKLIIGYILRFTAGMLIAIVPLIIWMWIKGALSSFFEQYIIFNLTYSDADMFLRSMAMVEFIKQPIMTASLILSAVWIILLVKAKRSVPPFLFAFLIYMIIQALMIVMAGTSYDHYFITAVPFILYPLSGIISEISKHKAVVLTAVIACFSIFLIISVIKTVKTINDSASQTEMTNGVITSVIDNSTANDTIIMFGNLDYIYIKTGRKAATRYSYTKPIIYLDKAIFDDYYKELEEHVPKILVIEFVNDAIKDYINRHSYYIIYESKRFIAYKTDE